MRLAVPEGGGESDGDSDGGDGGVSNLLSSIASVGHILALNDPRLGGGAGLGEAGGQGDAAKLLSGQVRRQGSLTPDFL